MQSPTRAPKPAKEELEGITDGINKVDLSPMVWETAAAESQQLYDENRMIVSQSELDSKYRIFDTETGACGYLCPLKAKIQVDYLNHLRQKPRITVPKYSQNPESMELIKSILCGNLLFTTPVNFAVAFMVNVLPKVKGILSEDWRSYDVTIGRRGEQITPLSLLEIDYEDVELTAKEIGSTQSMSDLGVLAKVMMVYRIAQASDNNKNEVARKLGALYASTPFCMKNQNGVASVSHWSQDPSYRALIAATDMFLRKFKNHEFEKLKACTLGSFMKDCTVMRSIEEAARALKISPSNMLQYAFSRALAEDIRRLTGGDRTEEKIVDHSYFQYMREMNLIKRSPYSARSNPNLFLWCQFIKGLVGETSSAYVRMVDATLPQSLLVEAAYVAYYLVHNRNLGPGLLNTSSRAEDMTQSRSAHELPDQEGKSPEQVYRKMRENEFMMTDKMKECFRNVIAGLDGSRKWTVGEYLKLSLQ